MKAMEKASQQLYDFVDYLQVEKNASLHTVNSYRADLKCFIAFARLQGDDGEALFSKADNILIRAYLVNLASAGYADGTILRRVSALKAFFKFLRKKYGIDNYPFAGIHIKADKKAAEVLSVREITELLNMPADDLLGIRDSAILELLYASGLKVSELVSLTVKDVYLEAKYVLIYGKKPRVVPIGCQAAKEIRYYLEYSRPKLIGGKIISSLFLNAQGSSLSDRSVRRIINKYADSFKKKISPNTFRNSMTAHLLEAGANVQTIKEITGSLETHLYDKNFSPGRLNSVYKGAHPRA